MKYLILLLIPTLAFANTEKPDEPTPQTQTQDQSMDQAQYQSAVSEGSTATATNNATGGSGGSSEGGSVGDVTTTITNKRAYRNTPNLGTAFLSANGCSMPAIFSLVLPGGGVQAGGGRRIDKECRALEKAAFFASLGAWEAFAIEYCSAEWREWFKKVQMWKPYDSLENCKEIVVKIVDGTELGDTAPPPQTYNDTALTQQIEALVVRVSAQENESKKASAKASRREKAARNAPVSPYAQIKERHSKIAKVE